MRTRNIEKKKDRRLFFCRIPTKTRLRVFLGDQHLCTGMSKRRKSDTGVDADEEAKLQPQTKHVITALSLRLAGVGQLDEEGGELLVARGVRIGLGHDQGDVGDGRRR